MVENWQSQSRLVENKPLTIVAEPEGGVPMFELVQQLFEEVKDLKLEAKATKEREADAWAPRLCNTVAQILLHTGGLQTFRTTQADYFSKQASKQNAELGQLAESMGLPVERMAQNADAVLTRRNQQFHPGSLEALEAEVAVVRRCLTAELERKCPQECQFLTHFEDIKRAFPAQFK